MIWYMNEDAYEHNFKAFLKQMPTQIKERLYFTYVLVMLKYTTIDLSVWAYDDVVGFVFKNSRHLLKKVTDQ